MSDVSQDAMDVPGHWEDIAEAFEAAPEPTNSRVPNISEPGPSAKRKQAAKAKAAKSSRTTGSAPTRYSDHEEE
jgi:hypothetical protein